MNGQRIERANRGDAIGSEGFHETRTPATLLASGGGRAEGRSGGGCSMGRTSGGMLQSRPRLPHPPNEEGRGRNGGSFAAERIGAIDKSMKPKFELQMRDARSFSRQYRKEHAHKLVSCNADSRSNIEDCERVRNTIQRVTNMIAFLFKIYIQFLPGISICIKNKFEPIPHRGSLQFFYVRDRMDPKVSHLQKQDM